MFTCESEAKYNMKTAGAPVTGESSQSVVVSLLFIPFKQQRNILCQYHM